MKTSLAVLAIVIVVIVAVGAYYATKSFESSSSTVSYNSTSTVQQRSGGAGSTTIGVLPVVPSTNSLPSNTAYTIIVVQNTSIGSYLSNAAGYTLYYYKQDSQNSGASTCNGGCASAWPPFYTSPLVLPAGLSASNFSTIIRSDGTKQLTYKGYPLYTYAGETAPYQLNGEGVGGFYAVFK